jgi:nucleotide-binding universal stress UspA family protein
VLVPIDGSQLALEALPAAADLAGSLGADVRLLWVIEPPAAPFIVSDEYVTFDPSADLVAARQYLDGVAATLRARGLTVEVDAELGIAASTIALVAREQHATVIAMTTHGRSGLARLVLGSVAAGTLRQTGVPLLLVRPLAMRSTA